MEYLDTIRTRKSVRSFSDAHVPREHLLKIVAAATHAPTSCNQQLWNFIVVDDPVVKERLVTEAAASTLFRRAPVVIVVTYDGWNYREAIQNASLAVGHMLLAATELGLGTCPINSYGGDAKVKKVLGIPDAETICCCVVLGYPDERAKAAPPVPRKGTETVIHWNTFEPKLRAPYTYDPNDWSIAELAFHQRHYCRKTSLGKEMDLADAYERGIVRRSLQGKIGPFLDLCAYEGSYIREFPEGDIDTLDLAREVAEYTCAAAALASRPLRESLIFDERVETFPGAPHTITLLYKVERLSDALIRRMCKQAYQTLPIGGELVIIARRRPSLFSVSYLFLRFLFGNDVRKTGIYAFFGPYRPVRVRTVLHYAKEAGFTDVRWTGYLAFPGFFEQLYHMAVQYVRSEGSSYLHRDRRDDVLSKSMKALLRTQGYARVGLLGSVVVMVCKK